MISGLHHLTDGIVRCYLISEEQRRHFPPTPYEIKMANIVIIVLLNTHVHVIAARMKTFRSSQIL